MTAGLRSDEVANALLNLAVALEHHDMRLTDISIKEVPTLSEPENLGQLYGVQVWGRK